MSLLLAACGGSGSTTTSSTASAEKSREQKFIQLAKCMREHGMPLEVETNSANGPGIRIHLGAGGPNRRLTKVRA